LGVVTQRILGVVSVLAAIAIAGPAMLLSQTIQRSMYVSVVDQSGALVPDLGPSDFIVREDQVSREILRVAPADEPMQIAILVDNSAAARDEIANLRRALPPFVEALTKPNASGRRNEVAIVALGERPTILADYTFDLTVLNKAIARIWVQTSGANYLLDATIEVTRAFKKREAARPVIVAMTTEGPEFSQRQFDLVLTPIRETSTAFHVITLGLPSRDINSEEAINRNMVLEEGPHISGGIRAQLLNGMALPAKLVQLGNVLTHEYRVTYAHPDSLIPPEHITVAARRADLVARGTPVKDSQARR